MVDLPEPRTVRQAPAQGPADTGQIRSEPLPTPGKRARSGADELSLADTRAGASSDTAGQQGTTPATVGEQPDAPAEKNPPVKGVKPRAAASASGVAKPVARSPASASESSAGGGSESIDPNAAQDAATPTPDTPSASPTTAQPELPLAAHESASGGSSESVDPHAAQTVASVTDATSNTSDAPVTSPWWGNGDANPSSLYFDYVRNKRVCVRIFVLEMARCAGRVSLSCTFSTSSTDIVKAFLLLLMNSCKAIRVAYLDDAPRDYFIMGRRNTSLTLFFHARFQPPSMK